MATISSLRETVNRRTRRVNDLQVNIKRFSFTSDKGVASSKRIVAESKKDLKTLRAKHTEANRDAKIRVKQEKDRVNFFTKALRNVSDKSRITKAQLDLDQQKERARIIASGNKRIFGTIQTIRKKRNRSRFGSVLTTNKFGA